MFTGWLTVTTDFEFPWFAEFTGPVTALEPDADVELPLLLMAPPVALAPAVGFTLNDWLLLLTFVAVTLFSFDPPVTAPGATFNCEVAPAVGDAMVV
jgi:hypothetical protein